MLLSIAKLFKTTPAFASVLENIYEQKDPVTVKTISADTINSVNAKSISEVARLKQLEYDSYIIADGGAFDIAKFTSDLNGINETIKIVRCKSDENTFAKTVETAVASYAGKIKSVDEFETLYAENIEPHKHSLAALLASVPVKKTPSARILSTLVLEYCRYKDSEYVEFSPTDGYAESHTFTLKLSKLEAAAPNSIVTIETGYIFSVNSNYVLIVHAPDQPAGCYVQPICIDGNDKGPVFVHAFTRSGRLCDVVCTMRLFSVVKSLTASQGSTTLAINQKDRQSASSTIWNLGVPCNSLVGAVELADQRENHPGVKFTPTVGAPITLTKSPLLILPRKRSLLNYTLVAAGGYVDKLVAPHTLTLCPMNCKIFCLTAPKSGFVFKCVETDEFSKQARSSGVNGNYSDLPQYRVLMKSVKKHSQLDENLRLYDNFIKLVVGEYELTDREIVKMKKILDVAGIMIDKSSRQLAEVVKLVKSDREPSEYEIKQKLEIKSTKRSVSDRKLDLFDRIQEISAEYAEKRRKLE